MKKPDEFYNFDVIYINNEVRHLPVIERILSRVVGNPKIVYVDDVVRLLSDHKVVYAPSERAKSLLLTNIRGEILKKCPCTHGHIACNYYIINIYVGCPLGCSYCILQSYLNQPMTIICVDIETIFDELDKIFTGNPDKFYRVGTGESGDSLIYDELTGFSSRFVDFIRHYPNAMLEFKTKTTYIDNIFNATPTDNMVFGFSVNPECVINNEEQHSARLNERVSAMKRLTDAGYTIALHFDPIVSLEHFEIAYAECVDQIISVVKPEKIAWASMGTFRYPPELKAMMDVNYPKSSLLSAEFNACEDKKFRYLLQNRIKYYKCVSSLLAERVPNLPIFLCMESDFAWKNAVGGMPADNPNISKIFKR